MKNYLFKKYFLFLEILRLFLNPQISSNSYLFGSYLEPHLLLPRQ